jgi:hypothetical protein
MPCQSCEGERQHGSHGGAFLPTMSLFLVFRMAYLLLHCFKGDQRRNYRSGPAHKTCGQPFVSRQLRVFLRANGTLGIASSY